ncbi:glucose--fructose oxidoreductase precursor [mine drainage metagenome]|uniref:Glucose--fructose oxidoreductase n=1 Tax=mine drainage metagenome TaxID=410659 RepID=A0A1J5PH82_9ZZZZ
MPNTLHAQWAIRAAQAGKHVLCEKPLALGLNEAKSMFDAARQNKVLLREAFPYEFQPQTVAMQELLHGGAIGTVRSVQACFGFTLPNPVGNIRLNPELGGGSLLDAGCYALSLIRLVMGCAPVSVVTDATWVDSGVDISAMATLYYADGCRAQLSCAMDTAYHRRATIAGSAGTLETEYANHTSAQVGDNPYGYLPSQLRLRRGTANSIAFESLTCDVGSGFRFAAEAFAQAVATQDQAAIEHAAEASLDNAATLEALARSARLGQRVAVEV